MTEEQNLIVNVVCFRRKCLSWPPAWQNGSVYVPEHDYWPATSLMATLADDERAALLALGQHRYFQNRQLIVMQGDAGDALFVLTAGVVKVTISTEGGGDAMLAIRSRGDLIGEVALFDGKPRAATAHAIGKVATVRISRAHFGGFAQSHPRAWQTIMKSIVAKMRESDERLAQRSLKAPERLALVVSQLALASADRNADGSVVLPRLTQADIADLADVAVASAERFFKDCRAKGIIGTRYKQIVVRDVGMLEKIMTHR